MSTEVEEVDGSLLRIGQEFAGYRVDAGLGRQSGVGRVYEATHLQSERQVALKVFSTQALRDQDLGSHFKRTASAQAKLRHENVVTLEEWGREPAPFIAMALVRGPTLADLLEEDRLGDRRVLHILGAVAAGLEAGRRRGLVYRRLQPRGVLVAVDAGDQTSLADFGAARPARSTDAIETGRLGSFADYISPEEADGDQTTQASVVYSLGAMIFEGLTGQAPYASDQQWATLRGHMEVATRSLADARADLPDALDDVLGRSMAKDPRARQKTPATLMREVDAAYPVDVRTEAEAAGPSRLAGRLRLGAVALVAVAAFAVLGALLAGGSQSDPKPPAPARLANGSLKLAYPADWARSQTVATIPGIGLADAVSVSPPGSLGGGELVAGRIQSGRLPETGAQVVDLGAVTARRYSGLREARSPRRVVAYVVPATSGSVVAACFEPAEPGAFAGRCARAASTLRAVSPGTAPSAASPEYARRLNGVIGRLARVRSRGRARLSHAVTRAGQGRIARRLGQDYGRLSHVMARIAPPTSARPAQRTALSQLRRASRGYGDMARAARTQRPGAWGRARRGVRSAEARFAGALNSLRKLGYDVSG